MFIDNDIFTTNTLLIMNELNIHFPPIDIAIIANIIYFKQNVLIFYYDFVNSMVRKAFLYSNYAYTFTK